MNTKHTQRDNWDQLKESGHKRIFFIVDYLFFYVALGLGGFYRGLFLGSQYTGNSVPPLLFDMTLNIKFYLEKTTVFSSVPWFQ